MDKTTVEYVLFRMWEGCQVYSYFDLHPRYGNTDSRQSLFLGSHNVAREIDASVFWQLLYHDFVERVSYKKEKAIRKDGTQSEIEVEVYEINQKGQDYLEKVTGPEL